MWKTLIVILPMVFLSACNSTTQRGALTGGAIGAGTGAVIGAIAGGSVGGALVGAAIGGAAGSIIGAVASKPGYCHAYDRYGNRVVIECPPGWQG